MKRVAVTGFGVVSPVGTGREAFWSGLLSGKSGIGRITRFDCDSFDVQLAGEVQDANIELPSDVAAVAEADPKVGYGFAALSEALEAAGIGRFDSHTLLHLGVSLEIFNLEKLNTSAGTDTRTMAGLAISDKGEPLQIPLDTGAQLAVSHFGRPGEALTNCSACAASAQAIGHSFRNIREGRFEVAVCGGFDSMINLLGVGGFQLLGALTADNERGPLACRPFDASRNGTVLGEGASVVVLEPLEKAVAEGKKIMAEVCGYGSSLDAYSLSAPDPNGDGAVRAMRAAISDAGIRPEEVSHINVHGTGTRLNDQTEAGAIRNVFDDYWENIPVSATKSMTGHLIAAAGAIEFGACLAAFVKRKLPPNPSLENVGRGCELNHVTGEAAPFDGEYALSNSFGFGGQNASLILRRYDG
ncbi:MAG: beta-ketoacyl-[acyl-carrier-protein] synthase family protein [Planctomycetota bacterium]|jgi:3-oxoacyl-[acyl-carrier-protein] synthase II